MPPDPRILPGWLVRGVCWVIGLAIAGHIPWAWSMSATVTELKIELRHTNVALAAMPKLQEMLTEHLSDPSIHHGGIAAVRADLVALEKRTERLERVTEGN